MDSLPRLTALAATLSLGLSVVYDYGYLLGLGLTFADLPTSIGDHARSALVWIPAAGLMSVFAFLAGAYMSFSASAERVTKRRDLVDSIVMSVLLGGFLAVAPDLDAKTLLLYSATLLALAPVINYFRLVKLRERLGENTAFVLFHTPAVALGVLIAGHGLAHSSLQADPGSVSVKVKADQTVSERSVRALRRFGAVTVIIAADRSVQIMSSDSIVVASVAPRTSTPIGCIIAQFLCRSAPGAA